MTSDYRTPAEWLRAACLEAARSDDPLTKNGAILVPKDGAYVAVGINRMPAGVGHTRGRLERPEKYQWIEHAERAAIYTAARLGFATAGATLYCPWFACAECARAIAMSGVSTVVGHVSMWFATPERWRHSMHVGETILHEARVSTRWISDPLDVEVLFNGRSMRL